MMFRSIALAVGIAFSACAAQAATYLEDFNASFPTWESGWLGTNSSMSNYYGVGAGRGNNPDGLWIGSTNIQFGPSFGSTISTLEFDIAAWGNGVINAYDSANTLIGSHTFVANQGGYTLPGTYQHFSFSSTNGISHFTFVGNSVLGNTSIDNVSVNTVSAVPETETAAMLLAGLGLMGAVARRRKAKQA